MAAAPWCRPARVVAIRRTVLFGIPRASSYASSASTSRCRALCYPAGIPASALRASANSTDVRCVAARSRATSAYAARNTCRRRKRSTSASSASRATGPPIGFTIGTTGSPISSASLDRGSLYLQGRLYLVYPVSEWLRKYLFDIDNFYRFFSFFLS